MQKLDGIWDFHFEAGKAVDEIRVDDVVFDELAAVPGCFDASMLHANKRGTGFYRTRLQCSGPSKLELDGIGLTGAVFWDNAPVARIDCAFSHQVIRFDAGSEAEHTLVIACCNLFEKGSAAQFCHYYDFYGYGGIYRSVKFGRIPEYEVGSLRVATVNAPEHRIRIEAEMTGKIPADTVFQIDGKTAGIFRFEGKKAACEITLPEAGLWSCEHPELHELSFCGETVSFGIRTVEAKNGKLLLNGDPLFLRGICRHDSHPEFGYALPESVVLNDLLSIRDHGFNCIRGSHYPQSETVLSLCDRLGILIWDETLGWQNTAEMLNDPEFERRQLEQVERIVRSSANHPCVILWGFLNEAHSETESVRGIFRKIVEAYHRADPTRPVTFATMWQDKDKCCDLCDVLSFNVYPGWYEEETGYDQEFRPDPVRKMFQKIRDFSAAWPGKPVLISEIGAEAQPGNHSFIRWSEEYQRDLALCVLAFARAEARFSGIFLWLFSDTRTYSNAKAQERCGGFNSKGLVDAYRRPKLAYEAVKKQFAESNS